MKKIKTLELNVHLGWKMLSTNQIALFSVTRNAETLGLISKPRDDAKSGGKSGHPPDFATRFTTRFSTRFCNKTPFLKIGSKIGSKIGRKIGW